MAFIVNALSMPPFKIPQQIKPLSPVDLLGSLIATFLLLYLAEQLGINIEKILAY